MVGFFFMAHARDSEEFDILTTKCVRTFLTFCGLGKGNEVIFQRTSVSEELKILFKMSLLRFEQSSLHYEEIEILVRRT